MSETIDEFNKLKPNQKFGIGLLLLLLIAFYPAIVIIGIFLIFGYFALKFLPNMNTEKNKTQNNTSNSNRTNKESFNSCPKCGLERFETDKFCPECGFKY